MRNKQEGYCHICGKYGELSFEHIPPENALNKNKAIIYTGDEALKRYKGEKARYINQQQGMGKYSLCEKCNNITGSWYVPTYSHVAKDVARSLYEYKQLKHGDEIEFLFKELPVLAFAKQIIAMFCSLLPLSEVKRLGFDVLLLNKESNYVDKSLFDLRIYLTPLNVGQLMIGPSSIIYKTETGFETIIACDLGAYPFGFILNLTPEFPIDHGTSIMNFFDTEYNNLYSQTLNLVYLERTSSVLPLPLVFKPLPEKISENRKFYINILL